VVLVDAGPLVALIHADDQHHDRCKAVLRSLREPMTTVWLAFTEAMYLLNFSWRAQEALWEMLERGVLLLPLDSTDVPRMRQLMEKYKDLPMDLADAALVRVAERERSVASSRSTAATSRYTGPPSLDGFPSSPPPKVPSAPAQQKKTTHGPRIENPKPAP